VKIKPDFNRPYNLTNTNQMQNK